jgi:hypothetical protein
MALGLLIHPCWAEPIVSDFFPRSAKAGSTIDLYFSGIEIDQVQELVFCELGFQQLGTQPWDGEATHSAQHQKNKKKLKAKKRGNDSGIVIQLKLAPNIPLGPKVFYLRSKTGVSLPLRFFIVPYEVYQAESEPDSLGHLMAPVCMEGRLKREDNVIFKINLAAEESCSIEVNGLRLNSTLFDPKLIVRDPEGREILRVDDTNLLGVDPWCSFKASQEGEYQIELRNSTDSKNLKMAYSITIGPYVRPKSMFPLGVQIQQETEFLFWAQQSLIGSLKHTLESTDLPWVIPKFGHFIAPSGHPVLLTQALQLRETEPNQERKDANGYLATVTPSSRLNSNPISYADPYELCWNGTLNPAGDVDWYVFQAQHEGNYSFEIYADRLKSPLDATLTLYNQKGKQIKENDDKDDSLDPRCQHHLKAQEKLWLKVEDRLDRGSEHHHYVLTIAQTIKQPELSLKFFEEKNPLLQILPVPRGQTFTFPLYLKLEDREEELFATIPELPPGWTCAPIVFPKNSDVAACCITIADNTETLNALLVPQLLARKSTFKQVVDSTTADPNRTVYDHFVLNSIPVSVVQIEAPKLKPTSPIYMVKGGQASLNIPYEYNYTEPQQWQTKIIGLPSGVSVAENTEFKCPNGQLGISLQTSLQAPVGKFQVACQAFLKRGATHQFIGSPPFDIIIEEPYLTGEILMTSVMVGSNTIVSAELKHLRQFKGEATLELVGLPYGCRAEPISITSDVTSASWEVSTQKDAPIALHKGLFLHGAIPTDHGLLQHNFAGGGSLRIDRPSKDSNSTSKIEKTRQQNLSRLEQLRLKQGQP